jgi:hypothetical protein
VIRCTLIIPDAGPLNSLWVADALHLLLALRLPVVVLDAIYDEVTSDPAGYAKDRDVKAFIDAHAGAEIIVQSTGVGRNARLARSMGQFETGAGLGEAAIAQFMNHGLMDYLGADEAALVLFEDADFHELLILRQPKNLHFLSTVAFVRGLEEVGIVPSADALLNAMIHPTSPEKRRYARHFPDMPAGIDRPAPGGSTWKPRAAE